MLNTLPSLTVLSRTARPDACLAEDHVFRLQGASHHVRPLAGNPTPAITAPGGDSSLTHGCAWKGTTPCDSTVKRRPAPSKSAQPHPTLEPQVHGCAWEDTSHHAAPQSSVSRYRVSPRNPTQRWMLHLETTAHSGDSDVTHGCMSRRGSCPSAPRYQPPCESTINRLPAPVKSSQSHPSDGVFARSCKCNHST